LQELKERYEKNTESAITLINDGILWKLTTRDEHHSVVRKIVSDTELTKSQMETLAVIAFRYPIKQADLIRIRTNKAYDHLFELERTGFVTRQKYGRSKLLEIRAQTPAN
jgi:segregation and condensation protein B